MKKILYMIGVILCSSTISAQNHIDSRLLNIVNTGKSQAKAKRVSGDDARSRVMNGIVSGSVCSGVVAHLNSDGTVSTIGVMLTMQQGQSVPYSELDALGARIRERLDGGRCVSMELPVENVEALVALPGVETISCIGVDQPNNASTRKAASVVFVNGSENDGHATPLTAQKYTGKDVVIGIIDQGIDYNHIAFTDSEGKSRVKKVVDYSTDEAKVLTKSEDIEMLTTDNDGADMGEGSHGTNVACIAAGRSMMAATRGGNQEMDMAGMAPDADLVLCGCGGYFSDDRKTRCIEEIISYADSVRKPCVINMSLGSLMGFHDNKSFLGKIAGEKTKNGVIIVTSTGNDGGAGKSLKKTLKAGEQFSTVLLMNGENTYRNMDFMIYSSNGSQDNPAFKYEMLAIDSTTEKTYSFDEVSSSGMVRSIMP